MQLSFRDEACGEIRLVFNIFFINPQNILLRDGPGLFNILFIISGITCILIIKPKLERLSQDAADAVVKIRLQAGFDPLHILFGKAFFFKQLKGAKNSLFHIFQADPFTGGYRDHETAGNFLAAVVGALVCGEFSVSFQDLVKRRFFAL